MADLEGPSDTIDSAGAAEVWELPAVADVH